MLRIKTAALMAVVSVFMPSSLALSEEQFSFNLPYEISDIRKAYEKEYPEKEGKNIYGYVDLFTSWRGVGVLDTKSGRQSCYGKRGFSDMGVGSQVVVYDEQKNILGQGEIIISDFDEYTMESVRNCRLFFIVPNVPADAKFYQLTVGNRKPMVFSQQELMDNNWEVPLRLGL